MYAWRNLLRFWVDVRRAWNVIRLNWTYLLFDPQAGKWKFNKIENTTGLFFFFRTKQKRGTKSENKDLLFSICMHCALLQRISCVAKETVKYCVIILNYDNICRQNTKCSHMTFIWDRLSDLKYETIAISFKTEGPHWTILPSQALIRVRQRISLEIVGKYI